MKIGIISDTHDHLDKIKEAVEIFNKYRVELVIHAGDFVAPFSLAPFKSLKCEWIGVLGNNDGEKKGLEIASQGRIKPVTPYFLEVDSRRIAVMHIFEDVSAPIIVCGHTHNLEIQRGEKLIINPGEACGWLTGKSSLVILDSKDLKVEEVYF